MLVYDVDGDGLNDVITAWHCHHYGLVWYKQIRSPKGEITWKQHVILPPTPDLKSTDLRISQMHALDLVDMNGDGLKDILTGKRFWAHGPTGDVEPNAPAVLYWFELQRDKQKGVQFIPHQIDDDSGVGTQVTAVDLNGDGIPDVIVGNEKGGFLVLEREGKVGGPLGQTCARVGLPHLWTHPACWMVESDWQLDERPMIKSRRQPARRVVKEIDQRRVCSLPLDADQGRRGSFGLSLPFRVG